MNIKRAKEEIEHTVKAYLAKDALGEYAIPAIRQRPILLMGPPGIGKTQVMEQVARECGVALVAYTITHHTRQSAVGLPFIRQRHYGDKDVSVTEYTMSEIIASIYAKMEATGLSEGILFIDEINCVSETLAPTMLQFLQCKTFGKQAVTAGWGIVAAGNPPEYNKSVRDFDIVTLDRVRRMDIEPDLPVWKDYARAAHIQRAILSYLELHPQNFYQINADVDGTQFVTARGWEDLSNLLDTYETLGLQADEELIREYIQHPKIAEDFSAYLDLYYKYRDDYGVEEILAGQAKPAVFARLLQAPFDERLSLVSLLLAGLDTRFTASLQADAVADACYAYLRETKKALATLPEDIPDGSADLFGRAAPVGGRAAPRQRRRYAGGVRPAARPVWRTGRPARGHAKDRRRRAGSRLRLYGAGLCGKSGDGGIRHRAYGEPRLPPVPHRERLRTVLQVQQGSAAGSPQGRFAAGTCRRAAPPRRGVRHGKRLNF